MMDMVRTIFIWIISLALEWETFKYLQVVGFVILIYGTFVFNNVVPPPNWFDLSSEKPVESRIPTSSDENAPLLSDGSSPPAS